MKLFTVTPFVLLGTWATLVLAHEDVVPFERAHSREIVKRARDCGTFRMPCANAAGACNNACYHIGCVNAGSRRME